jgi:hypothetical protein
MAKFSEMDEKEVTLSEQLEENVSPVILINKFNVKPEEVDHLLRAWAYDAAYFKSQLYRGIGGSGILVNYAIGESTVHLKKALNNVDLQDILSKYPASTVVSPNLFKKVAVPGICVDE